MRLQAAVRDLLLQSAVCYTRSGFGCFVICSPGPLSSCLVFLQVNAAMKQ